MESDRDKWNDNNYEELKKTISQFIPLIRFSEISRADFFDNVRPYKTVIPHNIYEEIMKFYMKDVLPITIISTPRIIKRSKQIAGFSRMNSCDVTERHSARWNPY